MEEKLQLYTKGNKEKNKKKKKEEEEVRHVLLGKKKKKGSLAVKEKLKIIYFRISKI